LVWSFPGFIDVDRSRSLFSPNTPGLVGDGLPTDLARDGPAG